ncbi:hypothetical protein M405DRAFT_743976, partial [Rhizopogon salebrosus TDB-379]
HVEFIIDASYPEMISWLAKASIGLSTMADEHFGINIVAFMVGPLSHTIRCATYRVKIGGRRDSYDARIRWSAP